MKIIKQLGFNLYSYLYNYLNSERATKMTTITSNQPIYMFGTSYTKEEFPKVKQLMNDLIGVTYRKGYQSLGNSYLTTDAGWGCAIRSTQALIVNAIFSYLQSTNNQNNDKQQEEKNKTFCINMISDTISAPLSIHNMYVLPIVQEHNPTGHNWQSPSTCSIAFSTLLNQMENKPLPCVMCTDHIPDCSETSLYLVSRIITQSERSLISNLFTLPTCYGFIGGIGCSALYGFALQNQTIYFLDPHVVQPIGSQGYDNSPVYTTSISSLDNSMTFAFICHNEVDCQALRSLFSMGKDPIVTKDLLSTEELDGFEVLNF